MSSNPLSKLIARADEAQTWEAVADGLPLEVIEALEWSNDSLGQCIAALRAFVSLHPDDEIDALVIPLNSDVLREARAAIASVEGGDA